MHRLIHRHHPAPSLRRELRRAATALVLAPTAFAAGYAGVSAATPAVELPTLQTPPATISPERAAAEARAARAEALIDDWSCWTGQGPADVIPGHAIVTLNTSHGLRVRRVGPDLTGAAIDMAVDRIPHPRIAAVHGFCK